MVPEWPVALLIEIPVTGEELTERVWVIALKVAVIDLLLSMLTVQVSVPVQTPDQPEKVELASAVAVSVTEVP